MSRFVKLAAAIAFALSLGGCAVKTLKAPCSREDGYSALGFAPHEEKTVGPFSGSDDPSCGPLRPINR